MSKPVLYLIMNPVHYGAMKKKLAHMMAALIVSVLFGIGPAFAASAGGFSKELGSAIADGDISTVQKIINAGADINSANKDGETPLMIAALEGRLSVVRFLVEKGANINAADGLGATPLLYAAEGGSLDVITFLVDKGADPSVSTRNGDSALTISEAKNNHKAVDYLKKLPKAR